MAVKMINLDESKIVQLYNTGNTIKQIACEMNVAPDTITKRLKKHGVPLRKGGTTKYFDENLMISMYKKGDSTAKIAELLGVTDPTIATRLRDNGVGIRPSNRPKFTNQTFADKLLASGVKYTQLEPYTHNGSKILFRCNTCSNEWKVKPYYILHGRGCPTCAAIRTITSCRKKMYTLGDRNVTVQGAEPHALDHIIKHVGVKPELIRVNITDTNQIPIISYFFNGKVRKHYPDIYIPELNTIYEVKSSQSLGLLITNFKKSKLGTLLNENKAKFVAGNEAGYNYEFLVHHKGVIINLPEGWIDLPREKLLVVCDDISKRSKLIR